MLHNYGLEKLYHTFSGVQVLLQLFGSTSILLVNEDTRFCYIILCYVTLFYSMAKIRIARLEDYGRRLNPLSENWQHRGSITSPNFCS